ncbi:hypothetical protein RhiirB3_509786 [Rhizophagus irregularis]|nr:hypothetical protein RhiirB3_509786 [Rhizophagus irregularis]
MAQHSNSVMGLLRLNKEGSLKFPKQQIISVFFKNMIQEFSKVIPVTEPRLSRSGNATSISSEEDVKAGEYDLDYDCPGPIRKRFILTIQTNTSAVSKTRRQINEIQ